MDIPIPEEGGGRRVEGRTAEGEGSRRTGLEDSRRSWSEWRNQLLEWSSLVWRRGLVRQRDSELEGEVPFYGILEAFLVAFLCCMGSWHILAEESSAVADCMDLKGMEGSQEWDS